jgi:hypothetical protein
VLDGIIEHYATKAGSHIGARAVARAWVDPQFKTALLEDATKAIASLGVGAGAAQHGRVHAVLVLSVGRGLRPSSSWSARRASRAKRPWGVTARPGTAPPTVRRMAGRSS